MEYLLWVLFTVYVIFDTIHHFVIRRDIKRLESNTKHVDNSLNELLTESTELREYVDTVSVDLELVREFLADDMEQELIMSGNEEE